MNSTPCIVSWTSCLRVAGAAGAPVDGASATVPASAVQMAADAIRASKIMVFLLGLRIVEESRRVYREDPIEARKDARGPCAGTAGSAKTADRWQLSTRVSVDHQQDVAAVAGSLGDPLIVPRIGRAHEQHSLIEKGHRRQHDGIASALRDQADEQDLGRLRLFVDLLREPVERVGVRVGIGAV